MKKKVGLQKPLTKTPVRRGAMTEATIPHFVGLTFAVLGFGLLADGLRYFHVDELVAAIVCFGIARWLL